MTRGAALENLGCTLLRQGHYDEAIEAFEAAIASALGDSAPTISLADVYLELGERPDYALELTQAGARLKSKDWLSRNADRHMWGNLYGNQAWAYARLGNRPAAEEALRLGFQKTDRRFMPGLAGFYYRAGRAMQALGDSAAAREYWDQAYRIDPQGGYGNLAARASREMDMQTEDRSLPDSWDSASAYAANGGEYAI